MNKLLTIGMLTIFLFSVFFVTIVSTSATQSRSGDSKVNDLNSWKELKTDQVPGVRICGLMVYDSESDIVILYGGFDGGKMNGEIWAYDYETNTWTNKTPNPSPPGRCGLGLIYDSNRDICILFGGNGDNDAYYNDTWKYDYNTNTWTELHPKVSPSPRCKGGIAYDSESDQIVWFGGYGPNQVLLDETWTYNYDDNTWVNRTSAIKPPARKRNPIIYDDESDRVIMFGGWLGGEEVLGDTWAYDFNTNTWTDMKPTASPQPRARYGRAYDPLRDVIIYTHGYGGEIGDFDDTWTYDYNTNKWTKVKIEGTIPPSRHCFQIALNTKHDVIILQGGHDGKNGLNDTWALTSGAPDDNNDKDDGKGFLPGFEVLYFLIGVSIIITVLRRQKRNI